MHIHIWSDLHNEFWKDKLKKKIQLFPDTILLCAGDVGEMIRTASIDTIKLLCANYKHVFYVLGNHDYYQSSFSNIDNKMNALEQSISNLTILKTGVIAQLGEYKLIGDTGWVPNHPFLLKYPITDLRMIHNCLPEAYNRFEKWREWASTVIDDKTIVMTHHLPSEKCVALRFMMEPTNRWFVGDCEDIILQNKPLLWIFGHTHTQFDFNINDTRLICNPLGYPGENYPEVNPLAIEI